VCKRTYKPIAVGLRHVLAHALLIIVTRDKDNLQQAKKSQASERRYCLTDFPGVILHFLVATLIHFVVELLEHWCKLSARRTPTGGGGSAASGTANVANVEVTLVSMTSAGSGCTSAPTISFSGGEGASRALASAAMRTAYTYIEQVGWNGVDRTYLAERRDVYRCRRKHTYITGERSGRLVQNP
jgi:hypothetical protein